MENLSWNPVWCKSSSLKSFFLLLQLLFPSKYIFAYRSQLQCSYTSSSCQANLPLSTHGHVSCFCSHKDLFDRAVGVNLSLWKQAPKKECISAKKKFWDQNPLKNCIMFFHKRCLGMSSQSWAYLHPSLCVSQMTMLWLRQAVSEYRMIHVFVFTLWKEQSSIVKEAEINVDFPSSSCMD